MATKKTDYKALNQELDELLLRLQAEDLDVDEAVKLYERGIAITKELKAYLEQAENTVAKIKADFSS
jgi:exodeoxyribonuclease VII small subunit